MNETNEERINTGEGASIKSRIFTFLDNFWYHYKWHSIIALFLIFTITICTFQFCTKNSYDSYILYAGNYEISHVSDDGDISEYQTATKMLERVTPNTDGDEKIAVTFRDMFILTDEEIREAEKTEDTEVHYPLIRENREVFNDILFHSDYYLMLLSPAVYEQYKIISDITVFEDIKSLGITSESTLFYSDFAVKLSSTKFYTLPGISKLPEDTLICLRIPSAYSKKVNEKKALASYNTGLSILESILNYEK